MKVASIVGARPQFIKAATVSRALRSAPGVREILVHTGQHYDENLSQVFFEEMRIPRPDHHLGIGSLPHGAQTGRMLEAIEKVLAEESPDWALVFGDTNSTLAGALAAAKLRVPLAHVEAGLRSGVRTMPEEINRIVADHVADLLFAPTKASARNLQGEGVPDGKIRIVGDVMLDASRYYSEIADRESTVLRRLGLTSGGFVLATVHRAENTDDSRRLRGIVQGLASISREMPVVLPLHPRTRTALERERLLSDAQRTLRIVPPVGYFDMWKLERDAAAIVTDSGGVQKEAFFNQVPCLTLRDETEWIETVELGWNLLCGADPARIEEAWKRAREKRPPPPPAIYGDGRAAQRIVEALVKGE